MDTIVINRNLDEAQRTVVLARGLYNTLTWDAKQPAHRESQTTAMRTGGKAGQRSAANAFASGLLMPRSSLDRLIAPGQAEDVGRLCDLAAWLGVSAEALGWRLSDLGRINEVTRRDLLRSPLRPTESDRPELFSPALMHALHGALEQGQLSARKAAKVLGLGLSELVELFRQHHLTAPYDL